MIYLSFSDGKDFIEMFPGNSGYPDEISCGAAGLREESDTTFDRVTPSKSDTRVLAIAKLFVYIVPRSS